MNKQVKQLMSQLSISVFVVLFAIDLAFILLHVMARTVSWLPNDPRLLITQDGGYAEQFQYVKELLIALGLGYLALRQRSRIFLTWAVIFLYILLDDSIGIHEHVGGQLTQLFQLPAIGGLRGQDLGEMLVFASASILSLLALGWSYRAESNRATRQISVHLFILLLLFAICGGVVDMLHMAISTLVHSLWLQRLSTILEDGGELVMISLIAAFVYRLINPRSQSLSAPTPIYAEKQPVK